MENFCSRLFLRRALIYPKLDLTFETCYVAENDLELLACLPPPLECWDYSCASPHLLSVVLGSKPRVFFMLHNHPTH